MKRWWIALVSMCAFTALAFAVHFGVLDNFDKIIREFARPDDVWGTGQLWADLVIEGLRPAVLAALLSLLTLGYAVKRRSLRPVAFIGVAGLATVAVTAATKIAVGRLNPHGDVGNDGGSFPSGHTVAVVVCVGLGLLMMRPRVGRLVWLIPAFGGVLMGASLLLQAAHWSTDITGGGLLATGVLAIVIASGASRWMHGQTGKDHEAVDAGRKSQTASLISVSKAGMHSRTR
jgi:membrane-associated phospholipid phosphatase